jgi:hypothetical protein
MDSHLNGLRGRGSYVIDSITEVLNAPGGTILTETSRTYTVKATFTEPLLMSPWIFRGLTQTNSQGIYGLQNLNFQFTLDPTASRCWRYADGGSFTKNVSLTAVNSARLLMCFMTPHPSLMLPSKNIVPYYTMDIYRNTNLATLPAATIGTDGTISTASTTITSNALNLNSIPDALVLFLRPKVNSDKTPISGKTPDWFFCIDAVNIQFNNHAGLCANMTAQDLWRCTVENGVHQSWEEYSGLMSGYSKPFKTPSQALVPLSNSTTFTTLGTNIPLMVNGNIGTADPAIIEYGRLVGCPGLNSVPTCGSVLMLEFGKDIAFVDEFYAPGSIGAFNLQVQMKVHNQTQISYASNEWELIILTKMSGMLVNERGTTSVYQSLLVKQDVLDTSTQEPYTRNEVHRLVGGGFFDRLWTGIKHLAPKIPGIAKSVLGHFKDENPIANSAHNVLSALGYGKHKGNNHKINDHLL